MPEAAGQSTANHAPALEAGRKRRLIQETWALDPDSSPAGSNKVTDPHGDKFLCCHANYREETKGLGAAGWPRRAVSTGTAADGVLAQE